MLISITFLSSECVLLELLPCDIPVNLSETETALCCSGEDGTTVLCVEYSGTSIGSTATYNNSEQLCLRRRILRKCTPDQTWDGDIPVTEEGIVGKFTLSRRLNPLSFIGLQFLLLHHLLFQTRY